MSNEDDENPYEEMNPLEEAIHRLETVLNQTPLDDFAKRHITQALLLMTEMRKGEWTAEELGIHPPGEQP